MSAKHGRYIFKYLSIFSKLKKKKILNITKINNRIIIINYFMKVLFHFEPLKHILFCIEN